MTIFICGDSTAADYPQQSAPLTGWGQALPRFLPGIRVENRAAAGRSTKSFLAEGRLQKIECEIAPGDVLLIQFAHNDESDLVWRHTDPWTSFMGNLSIFVDTARQYGATPVLMTPICLRTWKDGELLHSHGDYPEAMRTLARMKGTALVDMYEESRRIAAEMGEEGSRRLFMHLPKGIFPQYMNGLEDNAHTRYFGAEAFARAAAEQLKKASIV